MSQRTLLPKMPVEWRCDWCHATTVVDDDAKPEGWGVVTLTDCGLTGYTREDDVCRACLSKHNLKTGARI